MGGDITSMLLKPKSHSNWVCQSSDQGTNPLEGLLPLTEETGGIIIPFMKCGIFLSPWGRHFHQTALWSNFFFSLYPPQLWGHWPKDKLGFPGILGLLTVMEAPSAPPITVTFCHVVAEML